MEDLTFGEQVKIVLGRKGMTIKQLAELIEEKTGKKMSRQNLTQRLGRDNFQEQDMRMIAAILECPFQLSIMSVDAQAQPRSTAALEKAAAARTGAVERMSHQEREELLRQEVNGEAEMIRAVEDQADEPEESAVWASEPEQEAVRAEQAASEAEAEFAAEEPETVETEVAQEEETLSAEEPEQNEMQGERDMTIGELYEMHEELDKLEETVKAGAPVEEIKKEAEKPVLERILTGGFFLRRKKNEDKAEKKEDRYHGHSMHKAEENQTEEQISEEPEQQYESDVEEMQQAEYNTDSGEVLSQDEYMEAQAEEPVEAVYAEEPDAIPEREMLEEQTEEEFDQALSQEEEDVQAGEVNPYTGREYQTNSVRMHPTRIGYVQVYDRTIHKWTDMTEWAFLGLQERKKALLGKAYEPPIYLD